MIRMISGRYGDHLRVEQGKSSPDAFAQSAFNNSFVNDRGLRTIKFSYPSGGDQRRLPSATEDKLLVERLSQAMQIVIDHNRAYTQLSVNSAAQKWLKQFLDKVGWKELSENGQTYPPVRMFAIENGVLGGGAVEGLLIPKCAHFVAALIRQNIILLKLGKFQRSLMVSAWVEQLRN